MPLLSDTTRKDKRRQSVMGDRQGNDGLQTI